MLKSSLILSALTFTALSLASVGADAREVTRTKSIEGAKHSASTTYSRSSDKDSKTAETNRVTTTESGKTATTDQTIKINEDGSFTTSGTRTGYSGTTSTYNKTVTPGDAGQTLSPATATSGQASMAATARNPSGPKWSQSGLSWRGMHIRNNNQNRRGPNE